VALNIIPDKSHNLVPVSTFVQVRHGPPAVSLQVCRGGNIVGCADAIPEIATTSQTGAGRNNKWIVYSHIDLATSNDVYNL